MYFSHFSPQSHCKKIVFVLGICALAVLPANAEMLIKQALQVEIEVKPTQYSSHIVIQGSKALETLNQLSVKDKNSIIKTYNAINESLGDDSICKGGSFSIDPAYHYKEGKRIQAGFKTHYTLSCEFVESQRQTFNAILDKIQAEVEKNAYLTFPIPNVQLGVDENTFKESDSALNEKLLTLALQKAKEYSALTRRKCSIKEINLGAQNEVMPVALKAVRAASDSSANTLESIAMPTAKDTQKTLRGNVIFTCK